MEPKKRGRPAKEKEYNYPSETHDAFGSLRIKPEPPVAVAPVEPEAPRFFVELHIADKVFKSEGTTADEALSKLPRPEKLMHKGSITISDGEKANTVFMYPKRLKMLFMSKGYQSIQMKTLKMGMK